jgi:hypothetical protein
MGRDEKAIHEQTQALEGRREKKPYARPQLKRLGTVRELTHGHPSQGSK